MDFCQCTGRFTFLVRFVAAASPIGHPQINMGRILHLQSFVKKQPERARMCLVKCVIIVANHCQDVPFVF